MAVDTDLDDEFHDAFTASFDEQMPDVESAGQQSSIVEPEVAASHAGSYGSAARAELEMPEFDLDFAPELELAPDLDLAPETQAEVAAAPNFDIAAEPDRHLAAEFDRNAAAAPELELDPEFELDLALEPEHEVAVAPNFDIAAESDRHLAAEFDRNAAAAPELELDPEFELDLAPEPELDLAPEPAHDVAAAPGFDVAGEPDLELTPEFELDELDFSEPLEGLDPIEAAAPRFEDAPAYRDEVPAYADEALHEASDLPAPAARHDALAEVDMDFTGAFERAMEPEHDANADSENPSPVDLWAVEPEHQEEQGQQPAASDPLELSLEDELDAFLNAHPEPLRRAQATVDIAPEPAWQSAYPADARWAALEDEQEEAAQEIAAPPAPAAAASEPRRPFINPALISRHANFKVAAPAAAAPAPVRRGTAGRPRRSAGCHGKRSACAAATRLHRPRLRPQMIP